MLTKGNATSTIKSTEPAMLSLSYERAHKPAGLFCFRGKDMYIYPKDYLTVEELIEKLRKNGMQINSEVNVKIALTNIGYYQLKGYSSQFIDPSTGKYEDGTTLDVVLRIYHFDFELSRLLFSYTSQIEVSLKARLVNSFQITQDALVLNDPSLFNNKKVYWKNLGKIALQINQSCDAFVEHNFTNYEGAIPIWAIVEVMSFGTLSKIIKNLKTGNNTIFSGMLEYYKFQNRSGNFGKPSKNMFASWIQSVTILRNICAHNGRIYNRSINIQPQIIRSDAIIPRPQINGLYQVMLSMKYLRPTDESWMNFIHEFKALLDKYDDVCDLQKLSFPEDWENHFELSHMNR